MLEKIGGVKDELATLTAYKMDGQITIEMNVGSYCAMRMKIPSEQVMDFAFQLMEACE